MKKKLKKGFTLVELLVVIAILAILTTVSVVGYIGFTEKANKEAAMTELSQLKSNAMSKLVDGEYVDNEYVYFEFENGKLIFYKVRSDGLLRVLNINSSYSGENDKQDNLNEYCQELMGTTNEVFGNWNAEGYLESVEYTATNGYKLLWNISSGEIVVL